MTASGFAGSTFPFTSIAAKETSPISLASLQALPSALIFWIVIRSYGVQPSRAHPGWTALMMTGSVPLGTIASGRQHVERGEGGILFGATPILAVVPAPLFLVRESFIQKALPGWAAGFIGIALLMVSSMVTKASNHIPGIVVTLIVPLGHN